MKNIIINDIDDRMKEFIREHHILSLATSSDNMPYCCTCFYVYIEDLNMFVFTSDDTTKHAEQMIQQNCVAAAIALETSITGQIRGMQINGSVEKLENESLKLAKKVYLKKFPIAILKKTNLWGFTPDFIKMTDNRLGFGKKLIWNKNE